VLNSIKTGILGSARRLGYQITKVPRYKGTGTGSEYEAISPIATYAPWNTDASYRKTFNRIRNHTLVDNYRCWELWSLVGQAAKLDGGCLLEVGVWRGGTGALIAKKAELSKIAEPVYLCDTFQGVIKAGEQDTLYRGGEHADTSRAVVESLVREDLGLTNVRILQGIFPDETAGQIEDPGVRFRLCHIDVDVYLSAKDVMDWVWKRMVPGGIVVYDDFGIYGCEGIARAVNEQLEYPDRLILHNLNGHAVVIKVPTL
jgi:O-methyltransferase